MSINRRSLVSKIAAMLGIGAWFAVKAKQSHDKKHLLCENERLKTQMALINHYTSGQMDGFEFERLCRIVNEASGLSYGKTPALCPKLKAFYFERIEHYRTQGRI